MVLTTLKDVFRRLDKMHLGGSLGPAELNQFLQKASSDEQMMTSDYFRYNIASKFASNDQHEINERGFIDWFK